MEKNKNNLGETLTELIVALKPLSESYRLLVGAADELNGITLAHKKDLKDAIHRADNLGDIIDNLLKSLDFFMDKWLHELKRDEKEDLSITDDLDNEAK